MENGTVKMLLLYTRLFAIKRTGIISRAQIRYQTNHFTIIRLFLLSDILINQPLGTSLMTTARVFWS